MIHIHNRMRCCRRSAGRSLQVLALVATSVLSAPLAAGADAPQELELGVAVPGGAAGEVLGVESAIDRQVDVVRIFRH